MLTSEQKIEIEKLASDALDSAEEIWGEVGHNFSGSILNTKSALAESYDTQIPGHPVIEEDKPQVDDFIAIVADMRDSSKHLFHAIGGTKSNVSQLKRIFYETSALLPCLAKAISYENGKVTEYLGDGVLGLFLASEKECPDAIYSAHRAAKKCLSVTSDVVNPMLAERYSLPPLELGVGLAFSKTIVTVVGLPGHREAKVFGECVFRASKLSKGRNEIYADEALDHKWPTSKDGKVKMVRQKLGGHDGYLITT